MSITPEDLSFHLSQGDDPIDALASLINETHTCFMDQDENSEDTKRLADLLEHITVTYDPSY